MPPIKDPDSTLDYTRDWNRSGEGKPAGSGWLAASETISTSTWTVPAGLTKGADTHDDTTATVWLSGGTLGEDYTVTNRITTNQGRTDERSIAISIRNR